MADVTTYTTFLQNVVGIPTTALPSTSPWIQITFNIGVTLTPNLFNIIGGQDLYDLLVYDAATSFLLARTPDQPGQSWFSDNRKKLGLTSGPITVIQSAGDQGTSSSMFIPDWMKTATMQELQMMKDPYGQEFIGFMQSMGSLWGLS